MNLSGNNRTIRIGSGVFLVLVLWFSLFAARAQVRITTGELSGNVFDPQGNVVPQATVEIQDLSRGFRQSALASEEGQFRFSLLTPSRYGIEVQAAGFATAVFRDVEVLVGETTRFNATLQLTPAQYEVTVTAAPSVLDMERTHQADYFSPARLDSLPINQRNYLDFAQLAPGVVQTNSIGDAADYRVPAAPTSGLSFAGSNGRGNAFFVDGIESNGSTGEFRPSIPQSAVEEFQINRSTYSAEAGGSYGGAINVVSRFGTNEFRGSLFGYLRHRDIQARNFFDPGKSPFTRLQSGISVGGPIRRDRTHFFAAFERLDRHEAVFVPILRDHSVLDRLTPSQQELASFLEQSGNSQFTSAAATIRKTLTPGNNRRVQTLFRANSGVFPFAAELSQPMARLDHAFSDRTRMFVRLNFSNENEQNTRFGALVGLSRGIADRVLNSGAMISLTSDFRSRWVSVSRAGFSYYKFKILPNDRIGPAIDIAGFGSFGRDRAYPFTTLERHFQLQQTFYRSTAKHGFQFGADLNPISATHHVATYYGGQFIFGESVPLAAALDNATGDPGFSARLGRDFQQMGRADLVQSLNAPINSVQAFSLGIPELYFQGFGQPDLTWWTQRISGFVNENFRARPNLTLNLGLRVQAELNPNVPTQASADPRVGFAWSPARRQNFVVRGGYGFYHSVVDAQVVYVASVFKAPLLNLLIVPLSGLPFVVNPTTGQPLNSADIYQTLLAQNILGNRTLQLADLTQFGLDPRFRLPATWSVDKNYTYPRSEQASLELERQAGNASFSVSYNFSRVLRLPFARDRNVIPIGKRSDGTPIFGRVNPNVVTDLYIEPGASAFYHAMTLGVKKSLRSNWGLDAHYTWSKAIDDATDLNPDYNPSNQSDRRADRGLSYFHRKHRVIVTAVFQSNTRGRNEAALFKRLLAGWSAAPILSASSFRPFNVLTGFDNVGDGNVTTHRPPGAGRNIGIGPNQFTVDLRLVRAFPLASDGRIRLRWIGEVFNLFNRTNFESVNNIVGGVTMNDLPHPLTGRRDDPTKPLSFTSAGPPRQFQFGLELSF